MNKDDPLYPSETIDKNSKNLNSKQDNITITNQSYTYDYRTDNHSINEPDKIIPDASSLELILKDQRQFFLELIKILNPNQSTPNIYIDTRNSNNVTNSNDAVNSNDVTNSTNVNVSSSFDAVYQELQSERMQESHTQEELEEYKQQLDALKSILESDKSKPQKWQKTKDFIKWLLEQTYDVAKVFLPLIQKYLFGIGE